MFRKLLFMVPIISVLSFNQSYSQERAKPIPRDSTARADTMKSYALDEMLISQFNEDEISKIGKLKQIEHSQKNSISGGSAFKAVLTNPGLQTQAPGLLPIFKFKNVDPAQYGSFEIDGIPILGSPFNSFMTSTKLEGPFFNAPELLSDYTVKHSGVGIVKTDLSKIADGYGAELMHNPFKSYAIVNAPLMLDRLSFYADINGPAPYVQKLAPETRILPKAISMQARAQKHTDFGDFSLAGFRWMNGNNIDETITNAKYNVKQESVHDLFIFEGKRLFDDSPIGGFILRAKLGYENFTDNSNQNITDVITMNNAMNNSGLSISSTNAIIELESQNNTLGIRYNYISSHQESNTLVDEQLFKEIYGTSQSWLDKGFGQLQDYFKNSGLNDDGLTGLQLKMQEQLNILKDKYSGSDNQQKARSALEFLVRMEKEYFAVRDSLAMHGTDVSALKSLDTYADYSAFKNRLSSLERNDEKTLDRSIYTTKLYWEGNMPLDSAGNTKIIPSLALDRISGKNFGSYSLGFYQRFGDLTLSANASKNWTAFQRTNIDEVLKMQKPDGITAHIYGASAKMDIDSDLLSEMAIEYTNISYGRNESGFFGQSKEVDFSVSNIADLAYKLSLSIGGAEERDEPWQELHPSKGSIDKTMNLIVSWRLTDWITWTNNLRWHDGYWTNNTINGDYQKSTQGLFLDTGISLDLSIGSANIELDAGCTNTLPRSNEAYRIVVYNPSTLKPEIRYFNTLTIPHAQLVLQYKF